MMSMTSAERRTSSLTQALHSTYWHVVATNESHMTRIGGGPWFTAMMRAMTGRDRTLLGDPELFQIRIITDVQHSQHSPDHGVMALLRVLAVARALVKFTNAHGTLSGVLPPRSALNKTEWRVEDAKLLVKVMLREEGQLRAGGFNNADIDSVCADVAMHAWAAAVFKQPVDMSMIQQWLLELKCVRKHGQ